MGIHVAITAKDNFITSLFSKEDLIHTHITKLTIVESPDANRENYDEMHMLDHFDYEYKKFGDVDWKNVDLYLYYDSLENLKFLSGAAAQSVLSVDLSGYSAILDQMPVVVPRIDELQLEEVKEKSMCSLPHPQVSQLYYIINDICKNQDFLYVSVQNIFPVSFLHDEHACDDLVQETRDYFNFKPSKCESPLAFNVNSLTDVAPNKSVNFEGQIKRIMPQIDTVMVNNIVAPVFYGTTQVVTVGLTTGNTVDQGLIDSWTKNTKNFNGILYKESGVNPRVFMAEESENELALLQFGNVTTAENIKWVSVTDNNQMIIKQTIELMNLFVAEDILARH